MKNNNDDMKSPKNPKKNRLIIKFFIIVISIVSVFTIAALLVAMSFGMGYKKEKEVENVVEKSETASTVEKKEIPDKEPEEPINTKTNIAVFGTDADGTRTDVNFVVCFDSNTKNVNLVQIPRDTKVVMTDEIIESLEERNKYIPYHDGVKGECKFNEVHAYAGKDYANKFSVLQLEDLLGIKIDYYVKVDIAGFKNIVDAIGGVEMEVKENLYYSDPAQGLYINLKAGYQTLDGDKAEQLVRFRSGYALKDLKRIDVQQDFMKAFMEKILRTDTLLSNLPDLIYTAFKYVTTDFGITDALKYVKYIQDISMDKVVMETIPGEGGAYFTHDLEGTKEVVDRVFYSENSIPISSNEDSNSEELNTIINNSVYDSKLLEIEVSNGGIKSGMAGKKRDMLKEKGYTVSLVSTFSGKQQEDTRIIVKENGMGEDLKALFVNPQIEINPSLLTNDTDIKIILGLKEE